MNKTLNLLFSLIILATGLTTYAQDTTKHVTKKPEGIVVPSVYHPITRPGYRHLGKNYHPDTSLKARATTAIKPDTSKTPVQIPAQPVFTDNTLNGQYNALIKKMYAYERPPLAVFYKNFTDTLNATRRMLRDSTAKLVAQNKTIAGLQGDASSKEQSMATTLSKTDQMNFAGLPVSKTTFQYIMWGLVVVFIGFSFAIYSLSGSSRREAAYRTQLYEELEEEFKGYKVKANEKEKKLARELQTERNKVDELMGKK
jgi:hypothetical protein